MARTLEAAEVDVACGWAHTVVRAEDGALYACDRNNYGALGLGHNANQHELAHVSDVPRASELARGWGHTWNRSADGELYSWGYNANGEFGVGHASVRNRPQRVAYAGGLAMCTMMCATQGEGAGGPPKRAGAPWPLIA